MKKLALALVCLVSVAFFASCDPTTPVVENPEPSIAIVADSGYLYDGQVIELGVEYPYGFRAASNAETLKELAKLEITCAMGENTTVLCDTTITGTEFVFNGIIYFEEAEENREIIGSAEITATVTDAAGEKKSITLKVDVNKEETLSVKDVEWSRKGSNLQGETSEEMAQCGLQWTSRDAFHANIRPLNDDCKLFVIENNAADFEGITTETEKAAYFATLLETSRPVDEYRNISVAVTGDKEYNDILAVIDAEGNQHLVLIEKANVQTGSFGVWTTITGEVK